jgi:hypothetical protein
VPTTESIVSPGNDKYAAARPPLARQLTNVSIFAAFCDRIKRDMRGSKLFLGM